MVAAPPDPAAAGTAQPGPARSGGVTHRPLGPLRRAAALLSPAAAIAGQLALQRDLAPRRDRLVGAARDRLQQRRRPTRPTMRALIASGGARLDWRAVPVPLLPGPDGALVQPIAVATCDLDRSLVLGATPFPLPLSLGHECVAEVVEVGANVAEVQPGQRVVLPFQISCGRCPKCRAGFTSNCAAVPPLSMYGFGLGGGHWGGVLADQVAVPFADAMLVPLPDGVDPAAAASAADTMCDAYRHVAPYLPELLRRDPDAEVLVVAALGERSLISASVPLYAGLIARALGARHVRVVDGRPEVRALAERLELTPVRPRELRRLRPAPLVVSATATRRGVWAALSATGEDGVCSCIGGLHRTARVPVVRLYGRNASFHVGRTNTRAVLPAVLDLIAAGRFRPERVTTTRGGLDDAPRLLTAHCRGADVKTVLVR